MSYYNAHSKKLCLDELLDKIWYLFWQKKVSQLAFLTTKDKNNLPKTFIKR